jgi:catechol 2,3-dioxygenase-like lactoylglutathione lyase family enzyme
MSVQHVDLVVSSIERSLPFYRQLLAPLGFHRVGEVEGERGETIWYLSGVACAIGLREAQTPSEGEYDRYRVGTSPLRPPRAARSTSVPTGFAARAPRSRAARRNTPTCRGITRCSSMTPTE